MSDVTAFTSFNNNTSKRVLDLLEAGDLRLRYVVVERITVIEFGVNDGGGNGASCVGVKVRTDTTKLSDMIIARFGMAEIWSEKVKCSSKMKPSLRAE